MNHLHFYYNGENNICTVFYTLGKEPLVLERNIKTVLKKIYRYYMLDIKEVRKKYSSIISSPNNLPIPFSEKAVFIPVKIRKPIIKNDGAIGYVNMRYIKRTIKNGDSTIILLSNNSRIECLCNQDTVNEHIEDRKIVSRCF